MKHKSMMLALALAVGSAGGIGSLHAAPIHYDIAFTGGPPALTSGSFDYDPAIPQFSNFIVVWNGITLNLTDEANLGQEIGGGNVFTTSCGLSEGPALSFAVMSHAACVVSQATGGYSWFVSQSSSDTDFGFTAAAAGSSSVRITDSVSGFNDRPRAGSGDFTIEAVIPEPTSVALLGLSVAGLGWSRRKK